MNIVVRVSGGFAGFEEQEVARCNTEALTPDQRQRIETLIDQLSTYGNEIIGADMMQYTIEVDDGRHIRRIYVKDTGEADSPLQKLLVELTQT